MKRVIGWVVAGMVVLALPRMGQADKVAPPLGFSVEGGVSRMFGDLTYRIGEDTSAVGGPFDSTYEQVNWASKLKFPMDVLMADVKLTGRGLISNKLGWGLSLDAGMSVTDPDDKMSDSDWMDEEQHAIVSGGDFADYHFRSYTESDAQLDAHTFDLRAEIWSDQDSAWYSLFVGYKYEDLSFDVYGLSGYVEEWGSGLSYMPYSTEPYDFISSSEEVLTYDASVEIPYIGVGGRWSVLPRLSMDAEAGGSPYTMVSDDDHHLLRTKQSNGDTTGYAWFANLKARFEMTKHWFATAQVGYLQIHTEGDTTQVFTGTTEEWPGGMNYQGPIKIESEQTTLGVSVGLTF